MLRRITTWTRVATLAGMLVLGTGLLGAGSATAAAGAGPARGFPSEPIITNPFFPLQPGTTYIYDGTTGTSAEHEELVVTSTVKVITRIPSVQVVDSNWEAGTLIERTLDWYAQDFGGTVFYMGEFATQYKHGHPIGHAGSWLAGKSGAMAGIIMEASPRVRDTYRQEFALGVAEDAGTVLSTTSSVSTPFGTWINNVLLTKDFSYIETGIENKYYVPGIGLVKSLDVVGGAEVVELTGIQHA